MKKLIITNMIKHRLTLAIATALIASFSLLNCSKKSDPAPAATGATSAGTTTSGTTTSGTTSSGTTTSGTTTSGTTTSGSTTSGTTTSGSTTSGSTTVGPTIGGSGTFSINGANNIPTIMIKGASGEVFVAITQNEKYSISLIFGGTNLVSGNYSVVSAEDQPTAKQVTIAVTDIVNTISYMVATSSSAIVTVSGNTVTFNNISLKQIDGAKTIKISGKYTFADETK